MTSDSVTWSFRSKEKSFKALSVGKVGRAKRRGEDIFTQREKESCVVRTGTGTHLREECLMNALVLRTTRCVYKSEAFALKTVV